MFTKLRFCFIIIFLIQTTFAQINDSIILKEVLIKGHDKSSSLRKKAFKTQVFDIKSIQKIPIELSQLLNNSSGIRFRQSGGLGANNTLLINGFQGASIRYFKDDIPMDYLGGVFSLSSVPLNAIQRVEVYQGMLPANLGSDALGGAVNIITNENSQNSFLNLSSNIGSFNTYRLNLSLKFFDKPKKSYLGVNSFYNHSDNNYKINVPVINEETANVTFENRELFHNQFSNYFTTIYAGIQKVKWTDDFRISLLIFGINRNHNYGNTMNRAFGALQSDMSAISPTVRYKNKFWNGKLKLEQFLVYNNLHLKKTDTINGLYDWDGRFKSIPNRFGEVSDNGSLMRLKLKNFVTRTYLSTLLNFNSKLEFNSVYKSVHRKGSDPLGKVFPQSKKDVLSEETYYKKWALNLGFKSKFLENSLDNELLLKYFHLNTSGIDTYISSSYEERTVQNVHRWGIADAVKYKFTNNFFTRFSTAWTTRLPNQDEFFGDGNFIIPNLKLESEQSLNFNLGLHYENQKKWKQKANLFYRHTNNMINLVNKGFVNKYENKQNVKGFGAELDSYFYLSDCISFNGNITYQEFRLFGQKDKTYSGARLANTPYLFANLGMNFTTNNYFIKGDKLQFYALYNFMKSFYTGLIPRDLEPDGFLGLWGKPKVNSEDFIIPDQHLSSLGVTWSPNQYLSIGLGARNLFDNAIYDNFKIQNAGRNFNLKINYSITFNK